MLRHRTTTESEFTAENRGMGVAQLVGRMSVRATVRGVAPALFALVLGCDGAIAGGPAGRKGNDPGGGDGPTVRLVDGGGVAPGGDAGPRDMVPPMDPDEGGGDPGGDSGGGSGDTELTCEELGYLGTCDGDVARWCDDGEMKTRDCASMGQRCRWIDNSTGYYCADGPGGGGGGTLDAGSGGGGDTAPSGCASAIEAEELELTNQARSERGLPPLECDEDMARAARLHSQDMCDQGYFSHTSRDGRSFTDRLDAQGVSYRTAGENIAWGQQTPEDVHRAWMGSSGHRANILGSQYGRIGIGHVDCGGSPYWTQSFAD